MKVYIAARKIGGPEKDRVEINALMHAYLRQLYYHITLKVAFNGWKADEAS